MVGSVILTLCSRYAYDPSTTGEGDKLVGCEMAAVETEFKTVFEDLKKRPLDKRKRDKNSDPVDIEGYLGPWAKYKDEETVQDPMMRMLRTWRNILQRNR